MKIYNLYEKGSDDRLGTYSTREKAIAAVLTWWDDSDNLSQEERRKKVTYYYDIEEVNVE
jgi:hypothetical protein